MNRWSILTLTQTGIEAIRFIKFVPIFPIPDDVPVPIPLDALRVPVVPIKFCEVAPPVTSVNALKTMIGVLTAGTVGLIS